MADGIITEIEKQSQDVRWENWICKTCTLYSGSLICKMNMFIAFEGADMSRCSSYTPAHKGGE